MNKINKIVAGLLLFAILPLPYAYYLLLRIVVAGAAGLTVYKLYEDEQMGWAFVFGIIALLWNPFIPFYMDKSVWIIFDLIGAGIFYFGGKIEVPTIN